MLGVGVSFIRISHNKTIYTGMVYEVKDNYYLMNSEFEKFYVYDKNTEREIGDIVQIEGEKKDLSFNVLESGFDFKDYLNKKGVYSELSIKNLKVNFASFLKLHRAKKIFLSRFNEDTGSLVSSILFSTSEENELTNSIRDLHLGKFLVANGTYIYLYISLLSFLFSKLVNKKWAELCSFGVLNLYLIFVFPKFAIIRICFLYLFRWINKYLLNKRFKYIEILSISGLFFLLINPYLAMQDSFILGYSIPLVFYFSRLAVKHKGKILRKILPIVLTYLFMIPFELNFYNGIAPLSMLLQLIFTPIFLFIGLVSILCFFRLPLYKFIESISKILFDVMRFIKPVNILIEGPTFNPFLMMVYMILFFLLLYYIEIGFKPIVKGILMSNLVFGLLYFLPLNNLITNEVTFINVGQGDSCLIRHKQKTVLIDTGGLSYSDIARNNLIPFFRKNRIYDIDLVITTHDDFDHSGAFDSLKKNFKIKSYVNNAKDFPLSVGNITFRNYNNHVDEMEDENSKSLVIGFNFMNKDFLVMGDATTKIESFIMEEYSSIPCDILKVGHHGSDTSSSWRFLNFIKPKEAIVSVGKNNSYGLPSKKVINNLTKLGTIIKRTDYLGSITYKTYL